MALLDLLSTSPTNASELARLIDALPKATKRRAKSDLKLSHQQEGARCTRRAPFIYYQTQDGRAYIAQGCCNDWTCPRCGQQRARKEYGRIVLGTQQLHDEGKEIYFWTLTCRGKELSLEEAEQNYLLWTNRFLDAARVKAKRQGVPWVYIQITERQKRAHPHSHLLVTYCPPDSINYLKGERMPNDRIAKHDVLWSEWFRSAVVRAGLGTETEVSKVISPVGVATYVSKYLFKDSMGTKFPKGWRRIRYSRSFPRLPESENLDAFPVIKMDDWRRVGKMKHAVYARDMQSYEAALSRYVLNVMPPHSPGQLPLAIEQVMSK